MRSNSFSLFNPMWYIQKIDERYRLSRMILLLMCMFVAIPVNADTSNPLSLSREFRDGMNLPAYQTIELQGKAQAGHSIDIKLLRQRQVLTLARVQADKQGDWHVALAGQEPGGPLQLLIVDGPQTLTINNITLGTSQAESAKQSASLSLSAGFNDKMRFAANKPLAISGKGTAGQSLDVSLLKNQQTVTLARVQTDGSGRWQVSLPAQPAGGPFQLVVSSATQRKVLNDIFIGEQAQAKARESLELLLSTRFKDGMALEPGKNIEVSGLAAPRRTINVKLSKHQQTATLARVQANSDGEWHVTLSAQPAGGPFQLNVSDGQQSKQINDIIIGRADLPVVANNSLNKKSVKNSKAVSQKKLPVSGKSEPTANIRRVAESTADNTKQSALPAVSDPNALISTQFDDSTWLIKNLNDVDKLTQSSILWARKHVHFAILPKTVTLSIGQANQIEQIFINGQAVDNPVDNRPDQPSQVTVPVELLQVGDNLIVVKSASQWDKTAIIGSPGRFDIILDQFKLDLSSQWLVMQLLN